MPILHSIATPASRQSGPTLPEIDHDLFAYDARRSYSTKDVVTAAIQCPSITPAQNKTGRLAVSDVSRGPAVFWNVDSMIADGASPCTRRRRIINPGVTPSASRFLSSPSLI